MNKNEIYENFKHRTLEVLGRENFFEWVPSLTKLEAVTTYMVQPFQSGKFGKTKTEDKKAYGFHVNLKSFQECLDGNGYFAANNWKRETNFMGRLKANFSLAQTPRKIRNWLLHEDYVDFDMKACHPSILYAFGVFLCNEKKPDPSPQQAFSPTAENLKGIFRSCFNYLYNEEQAHTEFEFSKSMHWIPEDFTFKIFKKIRKALLNVGINGSASQTAINKALEDLESLGIELNPSQETNLLEMYENSSGGIYKNYVQPFQKLAKYIFETDLELVELFESHTTRMRKTAEDKERLRLAFICQELETNIVDTVLTNLLKTNLDLFLDPFGKQVFIYEFDGFKILRAAVERNGGIEQVLSLINQIIGFEHLQFDAKPMDDFYPFFKEDPNWTQLQKPFKVEEYVVRKAHEANEKLAKLKEKESKKEQKRKDVENKKQRLIAQASQVNTSESKIPMWLYTIEQVSTNFENSFILQGIGRNEKQRHIVDSFVIPFIIESKRFMFDNASQIIYTVVKNKETGNKSLSPATNESLKDSLTAVINRFNIFQLDQGYSERHQTNLYERVFGDIKEMKELVSLTKCELMEIKHSLPSVPSPSEIQILMKGTLPFYDCIFLGKSKTFISYHDASENYIPPSYHTMRGMAEFYQQFLIYKNDETHEIGKRLKLLNEKILNCFMTPDSRKVQISWLSKALMGHVNKYALHYVSDREAGKSTILKILQYTFGAFCGHLSAKNFIEEVVNPNEERKKTSSGFAIDAERENGFVEKIQGKRLVYDSDFNSKTKLLQWKDSLKALVGGDIIDGRAAFGKTRTVASCANYLTMLNDPGIISPPDQQKFNITIAPKAKFVVKSVYDRQLEAIVDPIKREKFMKTHEIKDDSIPLLALEPLTIKIFLSVLMNEYSPEDFEQDAEEFLSKNLGLEDDEEIELNINNILTSHITTNPFPDGTLAHIPVSIFNQLVKNNQDRDQLKREFSKEIKTCNKKGCCNRNKAIFGMRFKPTILNDFEKLGYNSQIDLAKILHTHIIANETFSDSVVLDSVVLAHSGAISSAHSGAISSAVEIASSSSSSMSLATSSPVQFHQEIKRPHQEEEKEESSNKKPKFHMTEEELSEFAKEVEEGNVDFDSDSEDF